MRLLLNSIAFSKRYLFVFLTLLLMNNYAFSMQLPISNSSLFDGEPAITKRTLKGDLQVFTFKPLTTPRQESLEKLIERFKQVGGFVSLSTNTQNEVELITTQTMVENETVRLLMSSTRLFGYTGYQIIE
jgi:hypothetical protein